MYLWIIGHSEATAGSDGVERPPGAVLRRPPLQRPRRRHARARLAHRRHHQRAHSMFLFLNFPY